MVTYARLHCTTGSALNPPVATTLWYVRTALEQCGEFKLPLHVFFIDFEKTWVEVMEGFDSHVICLVSR